MSTFIRESDGATVTAAEACDARGVKKTGYRFNTLRDGEYARFDMAFLDAKPATAATSMTVADAIGVEVARQAAEHRTKFAFMGDRAPAFDHAAAALKVRSAAITEQTAPIRDAARTGYVDTRTQFLANASPTERASYQTTEHIRDAARRARHV